MFELHAIEKACRRVPGGLKKLSVVDPNDLATQPRWNVSQSLDDLDFLPGKAAYIFEKDLLSGRLEGETDTSNPAGDFFNYRLTATIRAIRPTVESFRAKLLNRRLHVIATYRDDLQRLLPWIRLSAKDDSGAQWNAYQGYTFTGVTRLLMPGPGVGGNIAENPPGSMVPGTIVHTDTTTDSDWSYEIPADRLLVVVFVFSASAQEVSLGTSAGGDQLGGPAYIPGGQYGLLGDNNLRTTVATTIHLSGLVGSNTIEVWTLVKQ